MPWTIIFFRLHLSLLPWLVFCPFRRIERQYLHFDEHRHCCYAIIPQQGGFHVHGISLFDQKSVPFQCFEKARPDVNLDLNEATGNTFAYIVQYLRGVDAILKWGNLIFADDH